MKPLGDDPLISEMMAYVREEEALKKALEEKAKARGIQMYCVDMLPEFYGLFEEWVTTQSRGRLYLADTHTTTTDLHAGIRNKIIGVRGE